MWFWGKVALFAFNRHFRNEVKPHADRCGYSRHEVLAATHKRLDEMFNRAWPGPSAIRDSKTGGK